MRKLDPLRLPTLTILSIKHPEAAYRFMGRPITAKKGQTMCSDSIWTVSERMCSHFLACPTAV